MPREGAARADRGAGNLYSGRDLPSGEAEHIAHGIVAGRSTGEPVCRKEGALGEERAVARDMPKLDPLAAADEGHGMFPDHIAATQGVEADFPRRPRARATGPAIATHIGEIDISSLRDGLRKRERGAARRIF